ncbi:unnamed protein product [Protopolystoma xenopodis]|uniref:Uncharacterized protein n=1 Tax=Protopolystoma xenopodis TaxID=117903 RepID=A0A448WJ63_9PLAT|nr:unnamed protein product [Protopolystoma xenopodis]
MTGFSLVIYQLGKLKVPLGEHAIPTPSQERQVGVSRHANKKVSFASGCCVCVCVDGVDRQTNGKTMSLEMEEMGEKEIKKGMIQDNEICAHSLWGLGDPILLT